MAEHPRGIGPVKPLSFEKRRMGELIRKGEGRQTSKQKGSIYIGTQGPFSFIG